MTKHTSGPWRIVHYGWRDKGKDGDFVGRIVGLNDEKVYAGAGSFHAINNLANAQLIAAAPALLEALERIAIYPESVEDFGGAERNRHLDEVAKIARAAIAAVKGGGG